GEAARYRSERAIRASLRSGAETSCTHAREADRAPDAREAERTHETNMQNAEAILSPYDGSVVGHMPVCGEAEIEAAIARAQRAFATLKRLPRFARADVLDRASMLVRQRRDELARLIAAEAGKPPYDARGEVSRATFNLANAAAEARRFGGEEVPLDMDAGVFEYQTTDA